MVAARGRRRLYAAAVTPAERTGAGIRADATTTSTNATHWHTTPSGLAAMTTHHGDYGRMGEANAAILAWCKANNRTLAGPSWEVYGHWTADPAQLRTDVYRSADYLEGITAFHEKRKPVFSGH